MSEDPPKKEEAKKEEAKPAATPGNATANSSNGSNSSNATSPGVPAYGFPYYLNWWEVANKKDENANLKDDTPFEIKSNPVYKKMIGRFLQGNFKDKNLEIMKQQTAKNTINHEEIGEEKEREGMYPNELDDEMQGYHYGDRINPTWRSWSSANWYGDYWGNQGTLAPPFNPQSHFESPYYDYSGNFTGYFPGGGYWSFPGYDPWARPWALLGQSKNNTKQSLA